MLVNLISIPYVTRVLSVEGYGNVNFATSISMWLSAICLVGIPTYGVRECARVRDDPMALARVVRELLIIITMFTAVTLTGFAVCIFLVPRLASLAALMWMFLTSTLLLSYGVEWYYQAVEQYEYITIRSMVFKVLSLIAILVFVHEADDWLIYGAIMALLVCANNLFNIVKLLRTVPLLGIGAINLRRHARPLASYAVLSIASSLYLYFDSVLLGMLNPNNAQVALYQLAAKLKSICFQVVNAIIGVLIPRLSYYLQNDPKRYDGLLKRGYGLVLNLCLGITLYLFIYAQPLVTLISSSKYDAAVMPVRIIGLVNFFSCMSYFFGLCILSPYGRESKLAKANLLGVPISIILNMLLDGRVGATGAAIACVAAEAVIFLKVIYSSRDVLKRVITTSSMARVFACNSIAFIAAYAVFWFVLKPGISMNGAGGSAIAVVIGFIVYSVIWFVSALALHEETGTWAWRISFEKHSLESRRG